MTDHRTVAWAIDILSMCEPIRCNLGGLWFGRNHNFADATFVDYGAADAFVVAAKALPALTKALAEIRAHLGAILIQTIDSDDQIIIDHVRKAHELAGGKQL
jgi:hypothetical protein